MTTPNQPLADGKIFIGNASGVTRPLTPSGDVTISNAGVTAIGAAKVTSAMLDEKTIRYATVTLTNSQIKALRATAIQVVAAPGASKVIQFLGAGLQLDAGTNVLSETDDNIAFRFENTTGAIVSSTVETTGWIDQAADTLTFATPKNDAIVATASAANKALMIHNTGDGEFADNAANDATIDIYVAYRVLDVTT